MEFTVPKFIDQEDKIFANITVRQFLIMLAGAAVLLIEYAIFTISVFLVLGIITILPFIVVAFVTHNGRPYHFFLISLIEGLSRPNKRIWDKTPTNSELKHYMNLKIKEQESSNQISTKPKLTYSKLNQLALIVDSGGGYTGEEVLTENNTDGIV